MTEDSILIRAERLIEGDIVRWANSSWRIELIEPVSLTEFEIVLEHGHQAAATITQTVSRDRKFRVLRLV